MEKGKHSPDSLCVTKAADIAEVFSVDKIWTKTGTGRETQPKQRLTESE